jgi:hypothetical protein
MEAEMNDARRQRRCPSDGELRLSLGSDVQADVEVTLHVESCARCAARLDELRETSSAVASVFERLDAEAADIDASQAYRKLRRELVMEERSGGRNVTEFWGRRVTRLSTTIAAVLAVVALVSFSPMRTLADDFLAQFRVQKFHAITIPMDMIAPLQAAMLTNVSDADIERMKAEFDALGSFETTFATDMESLPAPMTLDEARAAYGSFAVPDRMPAGFAALPEAFVTDAGSATYTMDVARAQEMVQELGLPIFSLPDPDAYPTVTFSVDVPQAVVLKYAGERGSTVVVGQMASPALNVPDGVDMDALREDILRFPGLPTDFVAELRSIDDWESTLIIPVPENATTRDVTVNGRAGLLIEAEEGAVVLWERGGVLYGVGGDVSGSQVLDIANAMD